ncbi:hypothetical protein JCM8547_002755 [Rhodosporidiobolus lusitaniae]
MADQLAPLATRLLRTQLHSSTTRTLAARALPSALLSSHSAPLPPTACSGRAFSTSSQRNARHSDEDQQEFCPSRTVKQWAVKRWEQFREGEGERQTNARTGVWGEWSAWGPWTGKERMSRGWKAEQGVKSVVNGSRSPTAFEVDFGRASSFKSYSDAVLAARSFGCSSSFGSTSFSSFTSSTSSSGPSSSSSSSSSSTSSSGPNFTFSDSPPRPDFSRSLLEEHHICTTVMRGFGAKGGVDLLKRFAKGCKPGVIHDPPHGICATVSTSNNHAYLCEGAPYLHLPHRHHHSHDHPFRRRRHRRASSSSASSAASSFVSPGERAKHDQQQHERDNRSSSHSDFSSSNTSSRAPEPDPNAPDHDCPTGGWGWILAVNERRRHGSRKQRNFQQTLRRMGIDERAAAASMGPHGRGCFVDVWRWRCQLRKEMKKVGGFKAWRKLEREVQNARMRSVLKVKERTSAGRGFCSPSSASSASSSSSSFGRAGSSSSSSSGGCGNGGGPRCGPFNWEAFRESLWYHKMHPNLANRRNNLHFRPRYRHVAPHGWVRNAHARMRQKRGVAYLVAKYSPDGRKVREGMPKESLREGAIGGTQVALGRAPARPEATDNGVKECYLYRNQALERLSQSAAARVTPTRLFPTTSSSFLHARASIRRVEPSFPIWAFSPPCGSSSRAARAFSTSSKRSVAPLLSTSFIPLLTPLVSVLKSSAALNVLTTVTRLSLTLLPLSARSRIFHALRTRYASDPASLASTVLGRAALDRFSPAVLAQQGGWLARTNAAVGMPFLLLAAPVVLLGLVALASLERTPVTGRWRVVMLSPAEEADLVAGVLSSSSPSSSPTTSPLSSHYLSPPSSLSPADFTTAEGTSRDWVSILRRVLTLPDEGLSAPLSDGSVRRVLLGGEVLDQRDWRVRWAEAVLRALEKGGEVALVGAGGGGTGAGGVPSPPPTGFPLEPRMNGNGEGKQQGWKEELLLAKHLSTDGNDSPSSTAAEGKLKVEYDLLVIDRPDANAFSFGFGPDYAPPGVEGESGGGRRGVIVLYTGFIDEILSSSSSPTPSRSSSSSSPNRLQHFLTPSTLPSQSQTKALAVLLSHELAHLCLDHTLEAYASTSLVVPHLMRLGSDLLRTALYPLTFVFGPFLNDALGKTLHEGAQDGFGVVGRAVNSCASRKLEGEADRVALRLLAGSGIDPHFALDFWQDRLASSSQSTSSSASSTSSSPPPHSHSHSHPHTIRQHSHAPPSSSPSVVDGLIRSHPVDEERVEAIKSELEGWERWWASHPGPAPVAAMAA